MVGCGLPGVNASHLRKICLLAFLDLVILCTSQVGVMSELIRKARLGVGADTAWRGSESFYKLDCVKIRCILQLYPHSIQCQLLGSLKGMLCPNN